MVLIAVGIPGGVPQNPDGTACPVSDTDDPLEAEPQEDWESAPKTPEEVWAVIADIAEEDREPIDDEIAAMAVDILSHFAAPDVPD